MPTTEDDFKQRFVAMMTDLGKGHKSDPEAMFNIGSLAVRLMDKSEAKSWRTFKSQLQPVQRELLLADFKKNGNAFYAKGKVKHAYAVQVLAMSVIASTQSDAVVLKGVGVLDKLIGSYITAYRKAVAMTKAEAQAKAG